MPGSMARRNSMAATFAMAPGFDEGQKLGLELEDGDVDGRSGVVRGWVSWHLRLRRVITFLVIYSFFFLEILWQVNPVRCFFLSWVGCLHYFYLKKNSACWFGVVGGLGFDSKDAQNSNSPLHSYH